MGITTYAESNNDFLMLTMIESNSQRCTSAIPLAFPPKLAKISEKEVPYDVCWILDKPVIEYEVPKKFNPTIKIEEEDLRLDTAYFNRVYANSKLQKKFHNVR